MFSYREQAQLYNLRLYLYRVCKDLGLSLVRWSISAGLECSLLKNTSIYLNQICQRHLKSYTEGLEEDDDQGR